MSAPVNVCEGCGMPVAQLPPDLTDGRWIHVSALDALWCEHLTLIENGRQHDDCRYCSGRIGAQPAT